MKKVFILFQLLISTIGFSQQVSMNDMSFWKPSKMNNWSIANAVSADLKVHNNMVAKPGKGVLVNLPNESNRANLESVLEHGDADISFDFMMAAESNSGFYLQGRYEVQLLDSWGVKEPNSGDCGGIYKRRRYDKMPNGNVEEYLWEGHAPRLNTCLAPGLWQHMDIQFRAPKFDQSGKKIANAKVLLIKMNGVVIHENVELTGPTGGPISETEAALGPIMIQGDHGQVAFRNITISNLTGKPTALKELEYKMYYGAFKEPKDFLNKKPDAIGKLEKLTWEISKQPNDFATIYNGKIVANEPGKHQFTFQLGGKYYVKIDGKEVLPDEWTFTRDQRKVMVELPKGEVPIEITVYKTDGWMSPITAMWIAGPSFREVPYHSIGSVLAGSANDPIFLDAKTPTILRSFTDLTKDGKKIKRVTHAVNVGNPEKLHYTYDLENGALVQVWKGDFLDTSPMWDNRGDGSSKPRGLVLTLNETAPLIPKTSQNTSSSIKSKGYVLDKEELPIFKYTFNTAVITDKIRITESKYLTRTISAANYANTQELSFEIAKAKSIVKVSENNFLIDEAYFIIVENAVIEQKGDSFQLKKALSEPINYAIIW
jgi:hypothetical protein